MIIWKPLIGECLHCVKQPTNKVNKNPVAVVLTNSHCNEEVVGYVQQNISMVVSKLLSLTRCTLGIFVTGKRINHGGDEFSFL